jgi:hypothetical protein
MFYQEIGFQAGSPFRTAYTPILSITGKNNLSIISEPRNSRFTGVLSQSGMEHTFRRQP